MAALVGCDSCGGVADPHFAQANWIMVVWMENTITSPLHSLMGQQQQSMEQRHFCSLDCVGIWAGSNDAIKSIGGR